MFGMRTLGNSRARIAPRFSREGKDTSKKRAPVPCGRPSLFSGSSDQLKVQPQRHLDLARTADGVDDNAQSGRARIKTTADGSNTRRIAGTGKHRRAGGGERV